MRLSIRLTTFVLLILLCGCRNSPEQSPANNQTAHIQLQDAGMPEPLRSLDGNLTVVKNTAGLPTSCRQEFVSLSNQSQFEMADPGQKFQVTDVIIENGLSFRRLVFGAFNHDRCLIHYERGGRGRSYYAVLFPSQALINCARILLKETSGLLICKWLVGSVWKLQRARTRHDEWLLIWVAES